MKCFDNCVGSADNIDNSVGYITFCTELSNRTILRNSRTSNRIVHINNKLINNLYFFRGSKFLIVNNLEYGLFCLEQFHNNKGENI